MTTGTTKKRPFRSKRNKLIKVRIDGQDYLIAKRTGDTLRSIAYRIAKEYDFVKPGMVIELKEGNKKTRYKVEGQPTIRKL